jgi:two-component system LytT family response regulator
MKNNFTCIIIDDEQDAIELLSVKIKMLAGEIEIKGAYLSWEDALSVLKTQTFDIVFLDISMPGKNGINLLKLLPDLDREIIFVTSHVGYMQNAFDFSTSGYLLKPVDDNELLRAISWATRRAAYKQKASQSKMPVTLPGYKIGIPNNKGIDYVNVNDILYLESINKCTKVVTAKGEYVSSNNLGKFKELTDKLPFFQVHRSFIINLHSVIRYESDGLVIMSDKREIPVARNIRQDFLQLIEDIF